MARLAVNGIDINYQEGGAGFPLEEMGIPFSIVGDAKQPRRIIEATEEGARAAWSL